MVDYHCVSYDYAHTGSGVCRMSHHTRNTLSHITEPYLHVNTSATYALHNCYNLSVTCHHHSMMATVTSDHLFSGKIYAKTRYIFVSQIKLFLPYVTLTLEDGRVNYKGKKLP